MMKITYPLLLSVLFSSALAYDWQKGASNVKWAFGCDFKGSDLYNVPSSGEDCGGKCANDRRCTHFTFSQGVCYLKKFHGSATATDLNGAVCGWVNRNSDQGSNLQNIYIK